MKKTFMLTVCQVLMLSGPIAAENTGGRIEVQIDGISSKQGEIIVQLYSKEEKLFGDKKKILKTGITGDKARVVFENIAFGEYAVFVFQDLNKNGTLDHNMFHIPSEPLGFTNSFRPTIFTGPPKFSDLKFRFNQDITLKATLH